MATEVVLVYQGQLVFGSRPMCQLDGHLLTFWSELKFEHLGGVRSHIQGYHLINFPSMAGVNERIYFGPLSVKWIDILHSISNYIIRFGRESRGPILVFFKKKAWWKILWRLFKMDPFLRVKTDTLKIILVLKRSTCLIFFLILR